MKPRKIPTTMLLFPVDDPLRASDGCYLFVFFFFMTNGQQSKSWQTDEDSFVTT